MLCLHSRHHLLAGISIGDIDFAELGAELFCRGPSPFDIYVCNDDLSPCAMEYFGNASTDSRGCPCHYRYLLFERKHIHPLPHPR